MMNYDMMRGFNGGGMMLFAWLTYLLVNIALVYVIFALHKYLTKK